MSKLKVFEGRGVRNVYEKVPTADGLGTTLEKVGQEEYTFTIDITERSLTGMGSRAASNITGKAVRGGLECKITSRRRF